GGLVSYGRRVAAMIINGLGFMNSRLYMTPHFFQDKPVAQLLGAELEAEHLNDDSLGRCLDKITEYGVTRLYSELAFEIAREKNLLSQRLHLDSTSFVLYGRYDDEERPEGIAHPDYGYSKANRADLKQVMLSLVQGGAVNIPLWMEALDGNSSDKTSFQETVRRVQAFTQSIHEMPEGLCFVVDAAFYVPEKLAQLNDVFWITRVPAQLKEAKVLLNKPTHELTWEVFDTNYRGSIHETVIYGMAQRWILIESQQAQQRELKTFQRQLDKNAGELTKSLWHLGHQVFQCPDDASQALKLIIKSLKYHQIHYEILPVERHAGKGRPKPGAEKVVIGYQIQARLSTCLEAVRAKRETMGRFILASNQCDSSLLNNHAMLQQYKEQSCVESSFKFMKNNAFELDSFFLKTPERITALMMIMTLCLMVYNFSQAHIRQCLKEHDETLPNQLGKPVQNPTMKWIAELMNVIAVVTIVTNNQKHRVITNVKPVHQQIISYFGPYALEIYGLPSETKHIASFDCASIEHNKREFDIIFR
ncbi:TPA: IS1634 family transposase, partial [Legionella pneumophila]|nr:IS1634 family transposase [Legionella pneumophila]